MPECFLLARAGSIVFAVAWIDATFQDRAIGLLRLVRPADLYFVGPAPDKLADLAAETGKRSARRETMS